MFFVCVIKSEVALNLIGVPCASYLCVSECLHTREGGGGLRNCKSHQVNHGVEEF
jgi:hypothetical protein